MVETLKTLSVISYVLAGISLLTSVILWFLLKIPRVIGDLSGRNARKSIAEMRNVNEKDYRKKAVLKGKTVSINMIENVMFVHTEETL